MVRLAVIFAVIAVVAGILGFVVDVAGAIAQALFFVFAACAVAALVMKRTARKTRAPK